MVIIVSPKHRKYLKYLSILLIVSFLNTQLLWAAGEVEILVSPNKEQSSSPYTPGQIDGIYSNMSNHVQKLRDIEEARRQINQSEEEAIVLIKKKYEEKYPYGDMNGDGEITRADGDIVLRQVVQLEEEERIKADVDGNGRVTAYDASLIFKYSVGMIDRFPVEENPHEEAEIEYEGGIKVEYRNGRISSIKAGDIEIYTDPY